MVPMKKALAIIASLIAVMAVAYGAWNMTPLDDDLLCESKNDCICNRSCGCVPKELKDAKCEFLHEEDDCRERGCECSKNKCVAH